jgi:hypothetical protein
MREQLLQKKLFYYLMVFALLGNMAFAQDTSFRRVELAYGISLDIPSHWAVLSQDWRKNLAALGEATTKNAGVEGPTGKKEGLLAVNAKPAPAGAMVRVSVISPPDYTQADLASLTPAELKEACVEFLRIINKMEASGGPKVLEMQPFRIEKINNCLALVMPYIRADNRGQSPWQVTQYKIPVSDRLIEITLSYRQSDAILWKPILDHIKRSLRF